VISNNEIETKCCKQHITRSCF